MEAKHDKTNEFCHCTHEAPGRFTFTSPAFSKATAVRVAKLGHSGTQTWDFAVEELSRHHTGALIDIDGKPFRFRSDNIDDVAKYDNALREDQKSHINRIKAKACDSWKGTYRLQKRMIYPMMLLWFALEVHDCRTTGKCSGAPSHPE